VLAAFAADALASAASELWARGHAGRALASGGLLLALAGWLGTARASLRDVPGASAAEAREVQLRKGASLRAEHIPGLDVTPCAYEHFALIAAYGAPERVTIHPASGAPLTSACPSVDRR
jgi:hypothetical protein